MPALPFETDLLERENELEAAQERIDTKLDNFITDKLLSDSSLEAKAGRRRAMYRAAYGEFMATYIFLFAVLSVITHGKASNWAPEFTSFATAFVAGLQAVAVCFAFSNVSGAHFNPAISFALWVTGKLSNRKVVVYIFVQLFASICAMLSVAIMFGGDNDAMFKNCVIKPADHDNLGSLFATEFLLTYIFTYMGFTIAFEDAESQKKDNMSLKGIASTRGLTVYTSNPQSKTGFAPFVIGFTIFSLAMIGGESGGAFNPARMFGPALLSNSWDVYYLYLLGQFSGSACAGLVVHSVHKLGLNPPKKTEEKLVSTEIPMMSLPGADMNPLQVHDDV